MGVELPIRTVDFTVPDDFDPAWQPRRPELACVANAVSLLMPAVEPYVVRSVRAAAAELGDEHAGLARRAAGYVAQESRHHREHRRLNRVLVRRTPALGPIERAGAATVRLLERRTSAAFGVAFAAGFEAVAYATARWVHEHLGELFDGADPRAAELFLWHLAEEVEHKDVARAVLDAGSGGRPGWRRRYAAATVAALVVLGTATVAATVVQLVATRRWWRPVAWARLVRWGVGYAFDLLPDLATTLRRDHRPADFVDPSWFALWLTRYPRA